MFIYFHADGSQTISRLNKRESSLSYDADRIVQVTDDGSVIATKIASALPGRLLAPLPTRIRSSVSA